MTIIRRLLLSLLDAIERVLEYPFPGPYNPFRILGALGFYFLWISFVSGIYVYIFFDTSVTGAYSSLQALQEQQWWLGGVMRSLHRYASDGVVVAMVLHAVREFALDRYRGVRWFSWVVGVPIVWLVIIAGITGYWLVWDERAQYVATVTAAWLDQLPIFGGVISRNFLSPGALGDRFFTLLMFIHIAVPMFLLFGLWIHLQRISRSRIHVPRSMFAGLTVALVILSFIKPALNQGPADLAKVPGLVEIDWFYLAFYPAFDGSLAGYVWWVGTVITLVLLLVPWLPPKKARPAATVQLEHCNGCRRCADDCPYNAINMQPRTDGRPFDVQAVVNPDLCVACGLCMAACPPSTPFRRSSGLATGIDLPDPSLAEVKARTDAAAETLRGDRRVIAFWCNEDKKAPKPPEGTALVELPCIGALAPSFIDYVLARDLADGVVLMACRGGDCFNRFGIQWTELRVARERDPRLRQRVPRERIIFAWDDAHRGKDLAVLVQELRTRMDGQDDDG